MGGYNSGRWHNHNKRYTTSDGLKIDGHYVLYKLIGIDRLRTEDLTRLYDLVWTSNRTQQRIGSINIILDTRAGMQVILSYRLNGIDKRQAVKVVTSNCTAGGVRYWLSCPKCNRRVMNLHTTPGQGAFYCRHCHDLTYDTCQQSHKYDRGSIAGLAIPLDALTKAELIQRRMKKHQRWSKRYKYLEGRLEAVLRRARVRL